MWLKLTTWGLEETTRASSHHVVEAPHPRTGGEHHGVLTSRGWSSSTWGLDIRPPGCPHITWLKLLTRGQEESTTASSHHVVEAPHPRTGGEHHGVLTSRGWSSLPENRRRAPRRPHITRLKLTTWGLEETTRASSHHVVEARHLRTGRDNQGVLTSRGWSSPPEDWKRPPGRPHIMWLKLATWGLEETTRTSSHHVVEAHHLRTGGDHQGVLTSCGWSSSTWGLNTRPPRRPHITWLKLLHLRTEHKTTGVSWHHVVEAPHLRTGRDHHGVLTSCGWSSPPEDGRRPPGCPHITWLKLLTRGLEETTRVSSHHVVEAPHPRMGGDHQGVLTSRGWSSPPEDWTQDHQAVHNHVDEHRPARSENSQPHIEWSSRPGSEPSSVEVHVYIWHYALELQEEEIVITLLLISESWNLRLWNSSNAKANNATQDEYPDVVGWKRTQQSKVECKHGTEKKFLQHSHINTKDTLTLSYSK